MISDTCVDLMNRLRGGDTRGYAVPMETFQPCGSVKLVYDSRHLLRAGLSIRRQVQENAGEERLAR